MRRITGMSVVICVSALAATAGAATLLSVDFAGLTPGQPVGIGGPTVGEPVSVDNCLAMIRSAPFPSNCLEFDDEADYGSGGAVFEFLEGAEVTTGTLTVSAKLWFTEFDSYYFFLREHDGAAKSFNTIYLQESGAVLATDQAGYAGVVGQYETGRAIALRIVHDLDAGTYDLWWDGVLVVNDRAHGVVGRGVGGVYTGIDHDADLDGIFSLDDLLVTTGPITAGEDGTWGGIKAAWR